MRPRSVVRLAQRGECPGPMFVDPTPGCLQTATEGPYRVKTRADDIHIQCGPLKGSARSLSFTAETLPVVAIAIAIVVAALAYWQIR